VDLVPSIERLVRSGRFLVAVSLAAAVTVLSLPILDSQLSRWLAAVAVAIWILLVGFRLVVADRSGRPLADSPSLAQRLDVVDDVVAGLSDRPWNPTLLPQKVETGGRVLLLPGAAYHLPEMIALAKELTRRGRATILGSGIPHFDRNASGMAWYPDVDFVGVDDDFPVTDLAAVVTMKDWAGYGKVIERARSAGVPTFAKVEGAQDFEDLENPGEPWHPYRHADVILCQGENDHEALDEMDRVIVGSTRLERLRWAPPSHPVSPRVVVNYNFSYGVLTDRAREWITSVLKALDQLEMPYVISCHPAVRPPSTRGPVTRIPISRLLPTATILVSRFSTVPFEAMARGIPFVYHNSHGEKMNTFQRPDGAFPITTDSKGLAEAIRDAPEPGDATRSRTDPFFLRQVSILDDETSEVRSAKVVIDRLGDR
jgi:hypothetical protein